MCILAPLTDFLVINDNTTYDTTMTASHVTIARTARVNLTFDDTRFYGVQIYKFNIGCFSSFYHVVQLTIRL
jgi:hypothetical protein